jgi:hypothetical protein
MQPIRPVEFAGLLPASCCKWPYAASRGHPNAKFALAAASSREWLPLKGDDQPRSARHEQGAPFAHAPGGRRVTRTPHRSALQCGEHEPAGQSQGVTRWSEGHLRNTLLNTNTASPALPRHRTGVAPCVLHAPVNDPWSECHPHHACEWSSSPCSPQPRPDVLGCCCCCLCASATLPAASPCCCGAPASPAAATSACDAGAALSAVSK